jgi:uncharacterized Zn finger protein
MSRRSSGYNSYDDNDWPAYVPVAERRRKAKLAMDRLHKQGQIVAPVQVAGRTIASTFWGKAWCDNLERYRDYANRIERGRTYVRNGSVVDLHVDPREVRAAVSGSELYKVKIRIAEVPKRQWRSICADCAGGIDSVVELLQGRFAKGVMERLCRQGEGLFPRPSEISFSCTCPDHASMCKHVAAALYGVGTRLDTRPELLFRLRAVNETDLVAQIDTTVLRRAVISSSDKLLEANDLSAVFGLDLAGNDIPPEATVSVAPTSPGSTAEPKSGRTNDRKAATKRKTSRTRKAFA